MMPDQIKTIKHIWFDFSETIALLRKERHNRLRYESYADVVGKPVTTQLIQEYEDLYKKHDHSNAAIFRSLGLPSGYWSGRINSLSPAEVYTLADTQIPSIFEDLKEILPISIFSNIKLGNILPALNINPGWFTHLIDAQMVKEPKPAPEGFYKIIELSNLPAETILYIGDHVEKDIIPAKNAGIKTGLMWKESDQADYCFKSFDEILSAFSQ